MKSIHLSFQSFVITHPNVVMPVLCWPRRGYRYYQLWRRALVRNSEAGDLLELFLVAAIASVLIIRAYLAAADYPQLGGDGLHIAHMLWGGAFMLVALLLLFTFLSRALQRAAAVLAGAGFGTFIDEVGKFITSDNNYFFEPAIGIIYIIFVAVFLVLRAVRCARPLTSDEALVNVLNLIGGAVSGTLDPKVKARATMLLDLSDPSHPLTPHLRAYVEEVEDRPDDTVGFYFRYKEWMLDLYQRLAQTKWFAALFLFAFTAWGIVQAVTLGNFALNFLGQPAGDGPEWIRSAQAASAFASGVCVVIGAWVWRSSQARAYEWYVRATLVSIFITQVFVFFDSQLAAMYGLSVSVAAYVALRVLASLERRPSS